MPLADELDRSASTASFCGFVASCGVPLVSSVGKFKSTSTPTVVETGSPGLRGSPSLLAVLATVAVAVEGVPVAAPPEAVPLAPVAVAVGAASLLKAAGCVEAGRSVSGSVGADDGTVSSAAKLSGARDAGIGLFGSGASPSASASAPPPVSFSAASDSCLCVSTAAIAVRALNSLLTRFKIACCKAYHFLTVIT